MMKQIPMVLRVVRKQNYLRFCGNDEGGVWRRRSMVAYTRRRDLQKIKSTLAASKSYWRHR
ncbi:hypothetical protein Hanom_Chr03g00193581 [Helianthus anomalus]